MDEKRLYSEDEVVGILKYERRKKIDDIQIRNELIGIFDDYDAKVFKLMHESDIDVKNFKEELNKINTLVLLDIRHRLTEYW